MTDLPIPVSVTAGGVNRDYQTIFSDLKNLITHYTPEWTYTGEDDLGITLLQLLSYLGDHLHYRADTVLRDTRASTTIDRDILVKLSEWLSYFPTRAIPAKAEVTISIVTDIATDFIIPKGTQVKAPLSLLPNNETTDVIFELDGDALLKAGETSVGANVTEGTTSFVNLGPAKGDPFEAFILQDAKAIFSPTVNGLIVRVNGEEYEYFQYPTMATPSDKYYSVRETSQKELEIRFGDGSLGRKLASGDTVTCQYRSGGGLSGLVAARAISRMVSTFTYGGSTLSFSVINPTRSVGGAIAETSDSIRRSAPAYFKTQNRAVTLEDYTTHALSVPGVFKANPVRMGVNGILFYLVPDNASMDFVFTDSFRNTFLNFMDDRRMATDVLEVEAADLIPIDVILQCFAFPAQSNATVFSRVRAEFVRTGGLLDFNSNMLGQHLRRSDMVNVIEDVEGLDYVDVTKYSRRPTLEFIINSGGATLSGVPATTDRTVEESWEITFVTSTTFRVVGSVTGAQFGANQEGPGQLGTLYTCKNLLGESLVSFKLNPGATDMQAGDRAILKVGTYDKNIQLSAGEFPVAGNIEIQVSGGTE